MTRFERAVALTSNSTWSTATVTGTAAGPLPQGHPEKAISRMSAGKQLLSISSNLALASAGGHKPILNIFTWLQPETPREKTWWWNVVGFFCSFVCFSFVRQNLADFFSGRVSNLFVVPNGHWENKSLWLLGVIICSLQLAELAAFFARAMCSHFLT